MSNLAHKLTEAFITGFHAKDYIEEPPSRSECNRDDKALRDNLSEECIDAMIAESFPASDPSSRY